jgi:predicted TIM-barrel fold metal-dependent hydrolase
MTRAIVISTDCHASAAPQQSLGTAIAPQDAGEGVTLISGFLHSARAYTDYFDPEYRTAFESHLDMVEGAASSLMIPDIGGKEDVLRRQIEEREEFIHEHLGATGRPAGDWDPDRRIKELEADGVVGDVIFPNGGPVLGLQGAGNELKYAAERAYNRWLADFCAVNPGRHAGVGVLSVDDVDRAVATVHWLRDELGLFGGIVLPNDAAGHAYSDERYDPLWAACAEYEMVVNIHGSPEGMPQYPARGFADIWAHEIGFYCHRPFWWLMWSGVFERNPSLKFAIVEQGAAWIPEMLHQWDERVKHAKTSDVGKELRLLPSEYFARQCFANWAIENSSSTLEDIERGDASVIAATRHEVELRYEIGVDSMVWGNDFPHAESTWPHSMALLERVVDGVPKDEVAKMVGLNAARCYGFDLDRLAPVAERVGPDIL